MVWPQFASVHSCCAKFLFVRVCWSSNRWTLVAAPSSISLPSRSSWFPCLRKALVCVTYLWSLEDAVWMHVCPTSGRVPRLCAHLGEEKERECIKLLIYDSKLFYFFYANLRCVVQAARKQSDKGSNCFFEICLCFLSRFTTKFRSAAVKVFWLPRRRPVLEWSQWFFVECGIPSILRRHMIQVESSHKCVHIQSVDCSHGGATAIYNVHTPFFISLCRAGYC